MKAICIWGILILLLQGCAGTYKPSSGGDVAYLLPPTLGANLNLFSSSSTYLFLGGIDEKGCITKKSKVKAASLNNKGEIIVDAGSEVAVQFTSSRGSYMCNVSIAATFEPNKKYMLHYGQGSRSCRLYITSNSEDGSNIEIEAQQLKGGLYNFCKA